MQGSPVPTGGQTFRCNGECKLFWRPGDMLLQSEHDWQGTLPGLCPKCSGLDPDRHKAAARASWRKREVAKGKESRLIRACTWKDLIADLEARKPGETNEAYRARCKKAWAMTAAVIATAFDRASKEQQALVKIAVQEFAATAEQEATVPYFIAPILVGAGAQIVIPSSWCTGMLFPSASGATEGQACFSGVRPERRERS